MREFLICEAFFIDFLRPVFREVDAHLLVITVLCLAQTLLSAIV